MIEGNPVENHILVLGSTGGVGKSVAAKFIKHGWNVTGLSRRLNQELKNNIVVEDFLNLDLINSIAEGIIKKQGQIHCIVNCIGQWGDQEKTQGEHNFQNTGWDQGVFNSNFIVADVMFRKFVPILLKQNNGRFITISSVDAKYPNTNSFTSSCSKSAVTTLSNLYKKKYRDTDVNFDVLHPGGVNTEMRKNKEDKSLIIQPEDIASLCYFLANTDKRVSFDEIIFTPKRFQYFK